MARNKGWSVSPLEQWRKATQEATKQRVTVLGFAVLEGAIDLSPVLTGRYRSNHVISFGEPDYSVDSGTGIDPGQMPEGVTTIYIQNNLPYAGAIEYGNENRPAQNVYSQAVDSALERVK